MPKAIPSHAARMKAKNRLALMPKVDNRPSAARRGYGRRWARLRLLYLCEHPMCEVEGCRRIANDVDHIKPRAIGGDDSFGNLQALCHSHHSQKTAREDGGFGHKRKETSDE